MPPQIHKFVDIDEAIQIAKRRKFTPIHVSSIEVKVEKRKKYNYSWREEREYCVGFIKYGGNKDFKSMTAPAFTRAVQIMDECKKFLEEKIYRVDKELLIFEVPNKYMRRLYGAEVAHIAAAKYNHISDYKILLELQKDDIWQIRYRPYLNISLIEAKRPINEDVLYQHIDEYIPMLFIQNSEVGFSSLLIEEGAYRDVCTNGLLLTRERKTNYHGKNMNFNFALDDFPIDKIYELTAGKYSLGLWTNELNQHISDNPRVKKAIKALDIREVDKKMIPAMIEEEMKISSGKHIRLYELLNALTRVANWTDAPQTMRIQRVAASLIHNPQKFMELVGG